jgi:hypothetical protein
MLLADVALTAALSRGRAQPAEALNGAEGKRVRDVRIKTLAGAKRSR